MQATLTSTYGSKARANGRSSLLVATILLLAIGLLMVASASISIAEKNFGDPWYFFTRQSLFVGLGLIAMIVGSRIPTILWSKSYAFVMLIAFALLTTVLLPGVGKSVNGSVRWLVVGPFNFQPSEFVKLAIIIFCAGYAAKRQKLMRANIGGLLRPLFIVAVVGVLLLAEPDFGAAVVTTVTAMGVLFLGGCRLSHITLVGFGGLVSAVLLVISSEYRMARLTAFLDPWQDPFDSGFQLTQALIAFGRGEWFGVGLGASVQKLFYLPEAHTDFLFAVIAEELGVIGAVGVILLFAFFIGRTFAIGAAAEKNGDSFSGFLCYGIAIWFGLQAFINVGVNMGLLPTKGLTLPLMSYGGSSMLTMCFAVGILFRVESEIRRPIFQHKPDATRWVNV